MATLTTAAITAAGTDPAYVAATAGGDKVVPGDTTWLNVRNASGVSVTVTVTAVGLCSQGSTHNSVVVVPAGGDRTIGPITGSRFAAVSDGLAAVTYTAVTSVTVAACRL
jgi:hypothetical protein